MERRAQRLGHLEGDGHAAPRRPDDHDIRAPKSGQPGPELPSRVSTIDKAHAVKDRRPPAAGARADGPTREVGTTDPRHDQPDRSEEGTKRRWRRDVGRSALGPAPRPRENAHIGGRTMRRRRGERAVSLEADQLVGAAAAILNGRTVRRYVRGEEPPVWVRVNQLAHADWDDLAELTDQSRPTRRKAWDGAIGFLAAELLLASRDPGGLVQVQRSALIPLELDLLTGRPATMTPTELVQAVRTRLAWVQARRTHPSATSRRAGPQTSGPGGGQVNP